MSLPVIPPNFPPGVQRYLRDLSVAVQQELRTCIRNTQGTAEVLLVSPSKKVYTVRVDDSGTISATLVNE